MSTVSGVSASMSETCHYRYCLRTLLLLIAFSAFYLAALKNSNELWLQLATIVALSSFCIGVAICIAATQGRKAFWAGFVVVGLIHWSAALGGISSLAVEPDHLLTNEAVVPFRNWLLPAPTDSSGKTVRIPREWKCFPRIAVQMTSIYVGLFGGCVCHWAWRFGDR